MKIFISERIEEQNFLLYIQNKLNISSLEYLDTGYEGIVYAINDYKVIKLTRNNPITFKSLINKNFKHLMNVYSIGEIIIPKKFIDSKGNIIIDGKSYSINNEGKYYYIISERLYELSYLKAVYIDEIYDMLYRLTKEYNFNIVKDINKNINLIINTIEDSEELNDDGKKLALELIECFKELGKSEIKDFDFHTGNIMMNKNNVLKLIDYDDNLYGKKTGELKNIIR